MINEYSMARYWVLIPAHFKTFQYIINISYVKHEHGKISNWVRLNKN